MGTSQEASSSPQPTKGFYKAIGDLKPAKTFIVAPISSPGYLIAENIIAVGLRELIEILNKMKKD